MAKWRIKIEPPFLGLASGALLSDYPSFGDARQAGDTADIDLTDPNMITQGPGLKKLTNGDQKEAMTTNVNAILDQVFPGDRTFGVGDDTFYEITDGEVNTKTYLPELPHEINSGDATAKDLAYYQGEIYYSWYSGSGAGNGDVGKYDMTRDDDSDFDDDFASAVGGATSIMGGNPMPLEKGGDDKLYLGHGYNVDQWDGTDWTESAFDIPKSYIIEDIRWNMDRLLVAANSPSRIGETDWISVDDVSYEPQEWTNASNAYTSDNNYATTDAEGKWNYYACHEDFGVPKDATVVGIEVQVEGKVSSGTGVLSVYINAGQGSFGFWGNITFTTEEAYHSVGGPGTLYGIDVHISQLLRLKIVSRDNANYSVDHIRAKVYYTTPDISGKKQGSVFIWNPYSEEDSWEQEIVVNGEIGSLYIHNGINYIFYRDNTYASGYKIGVLEGNGIMDLANFEGGLPKRRQITTYKNFIIWVAGEKVWAYGSPSPNIPKYIFQLADAGYSTVGALASPFGTPMVASNDGTNYQLAQFSGYATTSNWKSLMFNTGAGTIENIKVHYEKLEDTPARCDLSITYDRGKRSSMAYSIKGESDNVNTYKKFNVGIPIQTDFRVEADWSNGDAFYPVKINYIEINGSTREV